MALVQYSDIKNSAIQTWYDNVLLRRAQPYEVHGNFGQTRPMPQNQGNTVLFRRYEDLGLAKTPLTEGTTPEGSNLSVTDVTAVLAQYGDYINITDIVDLESRDPVLTEAAELLGEQMGKTRDSLIRDFVVGDYYTESGDGGSGDYTAEDGGGSAISDTNIENAIDHLLTANARFLTSVVRPSTGYNTTPIRPAFVAIAHPNMRTSIESLTGFTPVSQYPSNENIMDGEWGAIKNIRFLLTTQAYASGEKSSNYVMPIFAQDAYGITELTGGAASNIVKDHGSAGAGDPLNQRATSGWKMLMTGTVLNPKFMTLIANTK